MLEIKDFSKKYKHKRIFNHTNFEAKSGEIIILSGKSGVGKSTLLDIIAGVKPYDSGKYYYKNKKINPKNDDNMSLFRNEKIGYILQDFALIDDYSVLDNILLPTLYSNTAKNTQHALESKARNLAYDFELSDILSEKVKNISGGQKQRVAIIRSLILNPQIILADEPTTNLDRENFTLVKNILVNSKNEGKIVIIATHDERLFNISSKIYEINNYKLVLQP